MRGGGSKISLSLLMVSEIRLQQPSCLLCLPASTEGHIQCLDCSNQLSQSNFLPFLLRHRLLQSNLLPPHPSHRFGLMSGLLVGREISDGIPMLFSPALLGVDRTVRQFALAPLAHSLSERAAVSAEEALEK